MARSIAAGVIIATWLCGACGSRTAPLLGDDESGSVDAGGAGGSGALGVGGASPDAGVAGSGGTTPTDSGAAGAPPSIVSMAAGSRHTCILLDSGAVRCWGYGARGSLGYGNADDIGDDEAPRSKAGDVNFGGSAVQLAVGETQTCVLLTTGAVRCWGAGTFGQLGYGHVNHIGDDEAPVSAGDVDVGGPVAQIAAGHVHTCAVLTGGSVRCWGYGKDGRLGYGNDQNIGDDEAPSSAGDVNVGGRVVRLWAGGTQTCALLDTGAVRCWGAGGAGQLGYGNIENIGDDEPPAAAGDVDLPGPTTEIAAGSQHSCALSSAGNVRCWGYAGSGRLGYGNRQHIGDDETPRSAGNVDIGGIAVRIDSTNDHSCVLLANGAVRCWGRGNYGRLGYGNIENIGNDESPGSAGDVAIGGAAVQIAVGSLHSCAVLSGNIDVRCWGLGSYGRLGHGATSNLGDDETPDSVDVIELF